MSAPKLTEAQRMLLSDALNGPILINAFGRPLNEGLVLTRTGLLSWVFGGNEPYEARITPAGRAALKGNDR